jgi:hypothetical protein
MMKMSTYIKKSACIFIIFFPIVQCIAALNDPFPMGYAMGNFGAILWPGGLPARQPTAPAAALRGENCFGFSASATDYFDDMDNMADKDIRQACAGLWINRKFVSVKVAYLHFNALGIYREQEVFVSAGWSRIPFVSVSIEGAGYIASLLSGRNEHQNSASAGASFLFPRKYASLSFSFKDVPVKPAGCAGFAPPFAMAAGIHTMPHRFGAQGISVAVEPKPDLCIRFRAAQEFWIDNRIGIGAAVSANPLMIGLGVTARWDRFAAFGALVHHPVLGWSKGAGTEWKFTKDRQSGLAGGH